MIGQVLRVMWECRWLFGLFGNIALLWLVLVVVSGNPSLYR